MELDDDSKPIANSRRVDVLQEADERGNNEDEHGSNNHASSNHQCRNDSSYCDEPSPENIVIRLEKKSPRSRENRKQVDSINNENGLISGRSRSSSNGSSSSGSSSSTSGDDNDDDDDDDELDAVMVQDEKKYPEAIDETEREQREEADDHRYSRSEQLRRNRIERADMAAALEHIITVGNSLRHDHFREQEWKRQRKNAPISALQSRSHLLAQNYLKTHNKDCSSEEDSTSLDDAQQQHEETAAVVEEEEQQQLQPQPPQPPQRLSLADLSRWLHAEDVQVYGSGSRHRYSPGVWPQHLPISKRRGEKKKRQRQKQDRIWHRYHGDGLHPLVFCEDVLSRNPLAVDADLHHKTDSSSRLVPPPASGTFVMSQETMERLDPARNKYLEGVTTVAQEVVPRALLLRCWQRAVDAASRTILQEQSCPRVADQGGIFETINPISCTYSKRDLERQLSEGNASDNHIQLKEEEEKKTSEQNLQALGIEFPDRDSEEDPSHCPICQLEFDAVSGEKAFREHFYGSDNQRGCCWTRIEAQQRDIIGETLQKEAVLQLDKLFQLVFPALKAREIVHKVDRAMGCPRAETRLELSYGWVDIMNILEDTLASSKDRMSYFKKKAGGDSPAEVTTGTLEFQEGTLPMMLNAHVMEGIASRLVKRYAFVPK